MQVTQQTSWHGSGRLLLLDVLKEDTISGVVCRRRITFGVGLGFGDFGSSRVLMDCRTDCHFRLKATGTESRLRLGSAITGL